MYLLCPAPPLASRHAQIFYSRILHRIFYSRILQPEFYSHHQDSLPVVPVVFARVSYVPEQNVPGTEEA